MLATWKSWITGEIKEQFLGIGATLNRYLVFSIACCDVLPVPQFLHMKEGDFVVSLSCAFPTPYFTSPQAFFLHIDHASYVLPFLAIAPFS